MGGINATGQIMETAFRLIDKDTPLDAYSKASPVDGKNMQLVFSDEFELEGRSFYPVRYRCLASLSLLFLMLLSILRVMILTGKL